jgi:hypothetical protein
MTKDELAELVKELSHEELMTALQFLIGNDPRAAEDAIRFAQRVTSRGK